MPLMGSLYIGASGLQTSQNVLNTTAHNLTNLDTQGYTRQQVLQSTRLYNTLMKEPSQVGWQQVGLGVSYAKTRQVRDIFLDQTYREEVGRSSFYKISTETLQHIEDLLGESSNGEAFSTSISNLWTAVQELAKEPDSSVNQGLFVSDCVNFIDSARNVYDSLCEYQQNMNVRVAELTAQINDYAQRIAELNDRIVAIEAGGFEEANDLRDDRNRCLDALGSIAKISYKEDVFGYVSVQVEGNDLVKGDTVYSIELLPNENGFYTPYWGHLAKHYTDEDGNAQVDIDHAEVFDLVREVSSDIDTDIGELKAVLLARGDHAATYNDMLNVSHYNADISQSIIMNVQAEFDQLINSIMTTVNTILNDAGYAAGDENQFFEMIQEDGSVDANGNKFLSIANAQVNPMYRQQPALLSFVTESKEADFTTAQKLVDAFAAEEMTLNPNVATKVGFRDYYSSLVSQVANSGYVFNSIYTNQETTVQATENARQEIVGVSSDEELQYMIQFQNAYNAASRYINVINDMLGTMLNAFGIS
ncbi:MAG: flagellar hook-associated protein FlgK [Lachnospiraceae bacterium]|nr:flagellar hook-associated protein FlgK [Lachnospiraceae bacterium]